MYKVHPTCNQEKEKYSLPLGLRANLTVITLGGSSRARASTPADSSLPTVRKGQTLDTASEDTKWIFNGISTRNYIVTTTPSLITAVFVCRALNLKYHRYSSLSVSLSVSLRFASLLLSEAQFQLEICFLCICLHTVLCSLLEFSRYKLHTCRMLFHKCTPIHTMSTGKSKLVVDLCFFLPSLQLHLFSVAYLQENNLSSCLYLLFSMFNYRPN